MDSREQAAARTAAGRSVTGGALAPRKRGSGSVTLGRTPKGRLRVKVLGKPLGGHLPRAISRGKIRVLRSGYVTTYDGRDGVALRMFHFGTKRQPARRVIGLDPRQRKAAVSKLKAAIVAELRAQKLAR